MVRPLFLTVFFILSCSYSVFNQ
uniref:Uncharacterized protein MANES_15G164300 n=1 Tax=Rhizophora mucronata TaxID=61149 RepID=A0A2P2IW72_RHIMU